ncbi:MAG: ATP-binding protein, partial [Deltaproteobacteria bacterium]
MMELSAIIMGHEKEDAQLLQANMYRLFRKLIVAYVATAFCGLIVGTALILYIANDTIHSYSVIEDAVERFASGNEDGEVVIRGASKDELGRLAEGLNKMFRKLYEDRINEQQYINVLDWQAKESEKTAAELAVANISLTEAQSELEDKNKSLETNIMDLKDLNRRLADTRAQMLQSEKMASLGQLAAGVAHEINNPIAFVGSNLNALSDHIEDIKKFFSMCSAAERHIMRGEFNEATAEVGKIASFRESAGLDFAMKDSLQIISESSDGVRRISEIVRGLKDFSHVDGSDVMDYNINKCLEDSIKIAWHEIKYRADLNKELGDIPNVVCRPRQLNQVFLNIITNAAQAMGAEKGLISVRTYANDGVVVAEIEDKGCGMSDEVIQKIFDPFFTTKPVGKGTGLGLAIASGIIRDHGGSIDIESRQGVGSKFTIMLPIRNERLEAASLTA